MKLIQIYQICRDTKCPKFNSDILNCPYLNTCLYKNVFMIKEEIDKMNQSLDGKLHGLWIWRRDNGKKYLEEKYISGKQYGISRQWYKSGQKLVVCEYKDDKLNGKWIGWYKNGKKRSEGTFKDGKQYGKWIEWYENGKKENEEEYKDGKRIKVKHFDKNENEII